MDPLADVRWRARACRSEALLATAGDRSAVAVMAAATRRRDIAVVPFVAGTRFARGIPGMFESVGRLVSVDGSLPAGNRERVIARGIACFELHGAGSDDIELGGSLPTAGTRLDGRTPREDAIEAFATEMLCPADDWLRSQLVGERAPSSIARDLGLPLHLIAAQSIRAVCLPPLLAPAPRTNHVDPLDAAQTAAATWAGGPLLIGAGPGTGKTATLIGRIAHLLAAGVSPRSIVVLTFSTRAAGELRSRIAAAAPDASELLTAGTMHAFAHAILQRWHHRIRRSSHPRIVDRDGALDLLVHRLETSPLASIRELDDPIATLAPILQVISRCKEEMIGPAEYADAARAAAAAGSADAAAFAETAAIYADYQRLLEAADALDLGDLIAVAADLLKRNVDVAQHYQRRFSHVLLDEAQDLNRAQTRLLSALRGPATSIWAVGDERQSIYRFRGAEPRGVDGFASTLGGHTLSLDRTYRATPQIVAAFSAFAEVMGSEPPAWIAQRPAGSPVGLVVAATVEGELKALRDRIERLRGEGVGYGEQAVLARTHRTLMQVGLELERFGVPILYLGDLFVRPEIRDLLALLSIDAEPGGIGLLRVATQPPYDVPRADALVTIRWAATTRKTIGEALAMPIPGVSADGMTALATLGRHLAAATPTATAWSALVTWLLETHRSRMLCDTAVPEVRRVAIYQLLRLAAETGRGRKAFLARVRRIASLGEGHDHGVVASEAQRADAVILSTIHASKGLEFDAVHLPMASSAHVPLPRRNPVRPPPPGLERLDVSDEEQAREEQALWFTALSRARNHLTISYARHYGSARQSKPSPFLAHLGPLGRTLCAEPRSTIPPTPLLPQMPRLPYATGDLETFIRCPARYRFDVVDGLATVTPTPGRRRLLGTMLAACRQLETIAAQGRTPSYADAAAALSAAWPVHGPVGHRLEHVYRGVADRLVARLAEIVAAEVGSSHRRGLWPVETGAGLVAVTPHRVIEHPWGAVTVQLLGLRRGVGVGLADRMAVLLVGARSAFPRRQIQGEVIDLDGNVHSARSGLAQAVLATYRAAIAAIERGAFRPKPGPACPNCPYFFVCGEGS